MPSTIHIVLCTREPASVTANPGDTVVFYSPTADAVLSYASDPFVNPQSPYSIAQGGNLTKVIDQNADGDYTATLSCDGAPATHGPPRIIVVKV